jgi:parvulin-like peptidyl-prolyl isomerase
MAGSDAVVRSDVETELLRQKLNDQLGADVPATQEQIHARHILVADEATANSVLQRLNNGETFEALAAELSLDTSNKDQGGDLGWFPHGVMVSDFEDAAFKLQPGQLSPPVKTQFGYHIIRVDERDPNRPVDPQMLSSLKANAIQKWLDDEQKNHQIARFFDSDKQQWALTNGPKPRAPRA